MATIKDVTLISGSCDHASDAMQAIATSILSNDRNRSTTKVPGKREARIAGVVRVSARNLELGFENRVSISETARCAAMSERTFLRRFKQTIGVSPKKFLLRVRLEKACSLLAETDLSIGMIARRTGFGTGNRMANLFRRHLATTPTEYRAGVRDTTVETWSTSQRFSVQ